MSAPPCRCVAIALGRLFADRCLICGEGCRGELCASCLAALPLNRPACAVCARRMAVPGSCPACKRRSPPVSRVRAPLRYEGPAAELVQQAKYARSPVTARRAGELLALLIGQRPDGLLVPVPLHWRKYVARGFNQAGEMAAGIAGKLGLPLAGRLVARSRWTPTQTRLGPRQRYANLRGAFRLRGPAPRRAILVDDVMTTGATVFELARTLRAGGTREIEVWVLARSARQGGPLNR